MDLDTIKKLMEAMEESGTTRVSLKEENGFALELERSPDFHMKPYVQHAEPHVQHMQPAHQPHHKVAEELKQVAQSKD